MTSLFSHFRTSSEVQVVNNKNDTAFFGDAYTTDNHTDINVYDDLDALESGDAREFIPYNFLLPSKDWTLCKVYRKNYTEFTMVLEPSDGKVSSEKFMLTAKRVGDDFYISQYESFASEGTKNEVPKSRYCAVLKGRGDSSQASGIMKKKKSMNWSLLPACLCTGDLEAKIAPLPLASVIHQNIRQPTSGNDIRCIDVKLPMCSGEGGVGDCDGFMYDGASSSDEDELILHDMNIDGGRGNLYAWDVNRSSKYPRIESSCLNQRSLSASVSSSSLASLDRATSSSTSSSRNTSPISANQRCLSDASIQYSTHTTHHSNGHMECPVDRLPVEIASQIPMWDVHQRSFMMKFLRNRIRESSSKNFVFYHSDLVRGGGNSIKHSNSGSGSLDGKWKAGCEVSTRDAVLQFGKFSDNCYSLDFRRPVAPLHAFALALSSFFTLGQQ